MPLAIIILAAGKGTRMKSDLPKVLHVLGGRPMIAYVLDAARSLEPDRLVVVVGHRAEEVRQRLDGEDMVWVVQEPQLGTGHAVLQTAGPLRGFDGNVVVLSGDAPLVRASTLERLSLEHRRAGAAATVLTATAADPYSYGRIVRGSAGEFLRIVEERDASESERRIREVNSGIYCFASMPLFRALGEVRADNSKAEYYLTDVIAILKSQDGIVQAVDLADFQEIRGINTADELAQAESRLSERARGVRT